LYPELLHFISYIPKALLSAFTSIIALTRMGFATCLRMYNYSNFTSNLIIILTSDQLSMTQTILTNTVPPLLLPLPFSFCSLAQPSSTSTKLFDTGKPSVGSSSWAGHGKRYLLVLVLSQSMTLRKRGRSMPLFYCSSSHHY
jgi:hypothetical protein